MKFYIYFEDIIKYPLYIYFYRSRLLCICDTLSLNFVFKEPTIGYYRTVGKDTYRKRRDMLKAGD